MKIKLTAKKMLGFVVLCVFLYYVTAASAHLLYDHFYRAMVIETIELVLEDRDEK